jgi:hypothetical protein
MTVGDLRDLHDEDWASLGLTVFASRALRNALHGKGNRNISPKAVTRSNITTPPAAHQPLVAMTSASVPTTSASVGEVLHSTSQAIEHSLASTGTEMANHFNQMKPLDDKKTDSEHSSNQPMIP